MIFFTATFHLLSLVIAVTSPPSDDDIDWSEYFRFEVKSKMIEHKIIPTAVPTAPKTSCRVKFDWGEAEPGQKVRQSSNNLAPPTVTWNAKNNSFYLMMSFCVTNWFDIRHAPEQERNYTVHEWTEWIVYNIPEQNLPKGRILYDYEPSPPSNDRNATNLIIYLVYEQNGTIYIPPASEITRSEYEDRKTAAGFAKRYKLGNPVAGNFYYISYDQDNEDYRQGKPQAAFEDSNTLESDAD